MKRFLCVCQDGNVRSVGLAFLLHNKNGQEAIPVGWKRIGRSTVDYFCAWADYVVVLDREYAAKIPPLWRDKVRIAHVGPDRFGHGRNKELRALLEPIVAGWAATAFEIPPDA